MPSTSAGLQTRARRAFTLIEIMIVAAVLALIVIIAAPGFIRARNAAAKRSCQDNLVRIDSAKRQFAIAWQRKAGDAIAQTDLDDAGRGNGFLTSFPSEPLGYTYQIDSVGEDPTCSSGLPGHSLREMRQAAKP